MNLDKWWRISLFITGICTVLIGLINNTQAVLPDILIRIIGMVDVFALAALVFTTVKKAKKK